jgi:hypothetical protein
MDKIILSFIFLFLVFTKSAQAEGSKIELACKFKESKIRTEIGNDIRDVFNDELLLEFEKETLQIRILGIYEPVLKNGTAILLSDRLESKWDYPKKIEGTWIQLNINRYDLSAALALIKVGMETLWIRMGECKEQKF